MGNISSLIEVFKMKEISAKTRAKIIIKLGEAIDHQYGMNITPPLVYELVKELDPENLLLKNINSK